jgi:DNA polymerase, archaea type
MKDRMVFWIKDENGRSIRLEDSWTPSIYVGSFGSKSELEILAQNRAVQHYIKRYDFVSRYERIRDHEQSTVLQLTLADASKAASVANAIDDIDDAHDKFRLYNVDILPAQAYFYEHDLFPLAKCEVMVRNDGRNNSRLEWKLNDNVRSTNYHLPEFKVVSLDVTVKQEGRLPSFTDKIDTIAIRLENDDETTRVRKQSEEDVLYELMKETANIDPDFIFTRDGDEWVFPYLTARAEKSKTQLFLSREPVPILARPKEGGGITYFSYGQIHYRASSVMLFGRIHVDTNNSLIHDPSALHSLYEIARVCRMPLHTVSRSTIGRALTSMQFYLAHKRKLLVPWKPASLEKVKTIKELVVADRGGLIMEPLVGVHEKVAEFDFVSLYPSIITKLNVGADTINCDCCPGSKNIVPEIGYRICEKRKGLVAESLEVPLQNRKEYKHFRKLTTDDDKSWAIFDSRQGILRTIGHVSFGYQGHAHSHFGLIDGHIAICAWARFIANKARKTAEELEYDILHLIIDSLFVKKTPDGASHQQYMKLKEEIEKATNFEISYEGEYKWIAFLSSKSNPMVGVPNRYFGCYQDGTIKDRGIETRRHDTPAYFSRFQREILEIMAQGNDIKEVKALMPEVKDTFQKYKQRLKEGRVPLVDLIFTKMLSKDTNAYTTGTAETGAACQLRDEGKFMQAGQILQYVITDYYRKNPRKRAISVELITDNTTYDKRRYVELLARVCNSVITPFGHSVKP